MDVVGMMLQNSRNHTTQMYETCCWQWDENSNINWIDWFIESTVSTGQIEKHKKHRSTNTTGGWVVMRRNKLWMFMLDKSFWSDDIYWQNLSRQSSLEWKSLLLLTLVYPWKLDETIYSELMEVWSWDYIIGIGLMSLLHYIRCACKAN